MDRTVSRQAIRSSAASFVSLAVVLCCAASGRLVAQDIQVSVQEPPLYVGQPSLARLIVRGLDEQPAPTCNAPVSSPNLRAQIGSISPNVSRSVRIVTDPLTGRRNMQETKTVAYVIDIHVTAEVPGDYTLGPFTVQQGGKQVQAKAVQLSFQGVPIDPDMRVQLLLPDRPVYPDQRVPVTIEWWYAGDFDAIDNLRIYSPLFDTFDFAPDPEPQRRENLLPIDTKDGQIALKATVRRETRDGKQFIVLSGQRTLIPSRPGEYSLKPITATVRKVVQWARARSPFDDFGGSLFDDMFGERRRAAKTELARAVGEPLRLVVKPFPAERPESFAGAVGSGFSLEVSADRTVVRVGDPIRLTLKLAGAGNLENASLPPLAAGGGLDPEKFRLPEGDTTGAFDGKTKTFEVTVRVQSEEVSEIPALAYSWFDPVAEKFQTTRSKPIAMRVMPATIISADDVIRSEGAAAAPAAAGSDPASANGSGGITKTNPGAFSLVGADLSVEQRLSKLLRDQSQPFGGWWLQIGMYLVGVLAVVIAYADRWRKQRPQTIVLRRKLLREQRRRIEQARNEPERQAAEKIAGALRQMIAKLEGFEAGAAQQVIARCESIVFAPGEDTSRQIDSSLVDRALAVVDEWIKELG